MYLNPTQIAIQAFGSPSKLTKAIGASSSAPFRWLSPRSGRGEAGDIPIIQIRKILDVAKEKGMALTERDLLYGREVPDSVPAPEPVATG